MKQLFTLLTVALISNAAVASVEEKTSPEGIRYWVSVTYDDSCGKAKKLATQEALGACFETTLNEKECEISSMKVEKFKVYLDKPCSFLNPFCDYYLVEQTRCKAKAYSKEKRQNENE